MTEIAMGAAAVAAGLKLAAHFGGPKPSKWQQPSLDCYSKYKDGETVWVTEPNAEATIRLAKEGVAAMEPTTVPVIFEKACKAHANDDALKVERDGKWVAWTWAEYLADSKRAASAYMSFGLKPHDCVNIIGFNSPEWFIAQMGAIIAGGKAAGVYTTNEASACQYVAEHSEARLVVLEDQKQLDKYLTFRDKLPNLAAIIMWADSVPSSANSAKNPVVSWDAFLGSGTSISEKDLQKRRDAIKPGHCATLIYTSGTTGNPKAVMMSHDNMIFESAAVYDHIFGSRSQAGALPDNFRILSYLPLSHVAAQMLDIVFPIYLTAGGIKGAPPIEPRHYYTVWFARPDALKGTLKNSLVACRPTMFLGVPRVWEKIRESMMEIGRSTTGLKKVIATWAKAKALEAAKERQLGGSGSRTVAYLLAKKIVLSKIRQALGLDECLICLSGAAPIPTLVMEYFASLDLDILEVYGMSESTGGTTLNTPAVHKIGSVGPPVGPIEVKIDHVAGRDNAGEGEICYRGRSIMMGYMKEPGKTKDAIDQQGWLHSGDVGTQDEHGMVRITGRLKELIIGAGGENIAPVPIEDKIKELCPAISNAMMVGDKRKYNTILFTVKTELNKEDNTSTGKLAGDAERLDPSLTTSDEVVEAVKDKSSVWAKYLQGGLDEYNKKFSVSNAQKIQKFTVLPGDFSEKGGELTATLKLKRSTTEKKYQKLVDAMY